MRSNGKSKMLLFLALAAWTAHGALAAPAASDLTFPHIVAGGPIVMELMLTNPSNQPASGAVSFFDDSGAPLTLEIEGAQNNRFPFQLSAGGSLRWRTAARGELRSGYARVESENGSELTGSIIFRLAGSEVSIPGVQGITGQHNFAEFNAAADTGAAFANLDNAPLLLHLTLRNRSGQQTASRDLSLDPGEKQAVFISQLFEGIESGFEGTLHARADRPFAMLGLRQGSDGVLASLAGSPTAFQEGPAGSQIVFAVNSGIDLTAGGFSEEQLAGMTVHELTGDENARISTRIRLSNARSGEAVTLHLRFLNDQCRDVLNFVVVLPCQQEIVFDPFDFEIPGAGVSTRSILLGAGELPPAFDAAPDFPLPGSLFRSGRFLLVATAVGVSNDGDNLAELRFPNEIAPIGVCDVTPLNTGTRRGFSLSNLMVCNARPMNFDALAGAHLDGSDDNCSGPVFSADAELRQATLFTRTLVQGLNCLVVAQPPSCELLTAVESLGNAECGSGEAGAAVAVSFGGELFRLLP